ncbi:MAG TPA: M50 family metallopeptidase [Chloroflexota bacterium]|nr:M50 family metallopeptidase [Chloroflexota bacterium]
MSVLVFVVLLGILILVHELGHFILAKRAGVKVEEFGIGFPPRLFAIRRGETDYSLNLIPLGGYVRMLGEEDPTAPRSFASASRAWRFAILIAGATMNLIAAVFLFSSAYVAGVPDFTKADVVVSQVVANTPAAEAGLQTGDQIVSMGGITIDGFDQLQSETTASRGKTTPLVVKRDGKTLDLTITPRSNYPAGQGPMGIAVTLRARSLIHYSIPAALANGAIDAGRTVALTLALPVSILSGLIPLADAPRPMGPVGIFQVTSQATAVSLDRGWLWPILEVAAEVSAGLAVANLLPIPGLDGGRLLFVVIEAVRGRRINPQRETMIHLMGMAFLLSLVLIITYMDILHPVPTDLFPH